MDIPDLIRVAGNYIRTSTTTAFDSNDLAFDVYDPTKIENEGGLLEVEYDIPHKREVIYVLSKSGNTLTIADDGRGLYGTNAQDHPANSKVRDFFVSDHINQFVNGFTTGWFDVIETWTYASATTINVPAGAATYYAVGDKIKMTNSGTKYFYIVGVADTLLTVTGGSDYTVANAAITDVYVSKMESPVGFPSSFNWASLNMRGGSSYTLSSVSVEVSKFNISGRTVTWWFGSHGTGGGSAYSVILYTPPTTTSMAFATHLGHGRYWEGSTWNSAICYVNNPTTSFFVEKHNGGNWATSGNVGNRFLIQYLL